MTDWTNAEWADGPRFAAWLEAEGIKFHRDDEANWYHDVPLWRKGRNVKIGTVDAILISRFRHLSEIPDEVWTDKKPQFAKRYPPEVKAEVLANVAAGTTCAEEARRLGIAEKTVQWWARCNGVVPVTRLEHKRRTKRARELMEAGVRQIEIHRETGIALSTLDRWRTENRKVAA